MSESGLIERAEQRMLAPARERSYELRLLGATVLPQRQTIVRSPHGTWLFVDTPRTSAPCEYDGTIPISGG